MIPAFVNHYQRREPMERQLWKVILDVLSNACKPKKCPTCTYDCVEIVKIWLWAVIHDRPVSWACLRCNWPPYQWRRSIPSNATMSKRLRSDAVRDLLLQLEKKVLRPRCGMSLAWSLDGKPLVISGCSTDKQAGYGRATGGKAKGYKIHAIIGKKGEIAEWRIAPMNKDERVMAHRMLKATTVCGYVIGDANYDSNKLHQVCDEKRSLQLVTPRRYGPGRGTGNRKQTKGRLRSISILECPFPDFGNGLLKQRTDIERYFGNLTNWGGSLTHLPPWARTYRRVKRWVQAKMIINGIKRLATT